MTISDPKHPNANNHLAKARTLQTPSRESMLRRDSSVSHFWSSNQALLTSAWQEWEQTNNGRLPTIDESLFDAKLRSAIEAAWSEPAMETAVQELWSEVSYGVYQCQFFDPEKLIELRNYFNEVQNSGIPLRPPYGIALNRFGAMLDQRSEGFLATAEFQHFYTLDG